MSDKNNRRYFYPPPQQPVGTDFLQEMLQPLHAEKIRWERKSPRRGEISLAGGVAPDLQIPDPEGRLVTAFQDFSRFLKSAGIPAGSGYPLRVVRTPGAVPEAYSIDIGKERCLVEAADLEAVRRALVFLEDAMLRTGGPFLPLGKVVREPVIRSRIAFHVGMFERAGHALLPDEFLNRWAHDGINGVMLHLEELYPHRLVPEFEKPPEALFQTLGQMVQSYARFGIRLYLYVNEPKSFPAGSPLRSRYPELMGGDANGLTYYCTGTKQGRDFIAEGFRKLVAGVPGLGGLIVICVGERLSHCYSGTYEPRVRPSRCPRCSRRAPRDVLRDTLAAMERGVHAADPAADFIAWPYSSYMCWGERLTRDAASHVPPNAILMHNFDSASRVRQLGRERRADDYWLSVPGPSALFRDCARAAQKKGTRVFAKIMAGCSHELASVPYVPVPGNLYRRFCAMHELGVSGAMQNWGSGNDPSLMNRAAGGLAFAPLPPSEDAFLEEHARRDWGRHARTVARAWKHFQAAYDHCPVSIGFSYFGPLHNGPVWPLYLEPREIELGGNWRPDAPGGDLIGGCTNYHRLDEVITLCCRMRDRWRRGVRLMESLLPAATGNRERQTQIGLVQAVELQLESAVNILCFYALRERLAHQRSGNRKALLAKMKVLVEREIEVDRRLLPLAKRFPRLGFCPEANSHKYFPAQIRWRMRELKTLLEKEFPRIDKSIRPGRPLFPSYTGEEPTGYVYRCRPLRQPPSHDGHPVGGAWDAMIEASPLVVPEKHANNGRFTIWKAGYTPDAIYLGFVCHEPRMENLRADPRDPNDLGPDDQVHVSFFPSQFEDSRGFLINAAGAREYFAGRAMNDINPLCKGEWLGAMGAPSNFRWTARAFRGAGFWSLTVRLPFASLGLKRGHCRPLRFDIGRAADLLGDQEFQTLLPPARPGTGSRLGWLLFDRSGRGNSDSV
jgi:hypothetical protein